MTELQQDPQQVDAADDSDCFWFPNLEKCQETDNGQEENVEVVPAGPVEQPKDDTSSAYLIPIMGQVAYLTVTLVALSGHFLQQFRYRKDTKAGVSYYKNWVTYKTDLGTNYWELATMVKDYSFMGIWGIAFITQAASFFALHEINVQVWMYVVGLGGTLVHVVYNILMFLAAQTTYS